MHRLHRTRRLLTDRWSFMASTPVWLNLWGTGIRMKTFIPNKHKKLTLQRKDGDILLVWKHCKTANVTPCCSVLFTAASLAPLVLHPVSQLAWNKSKIRAQTVSQDFHISFLTYFQTVWLSKTKNLFEKERFLDSKWVTFRFTSDQDNNDKNSRTKAWCRNTSELCFNRLHVNEREQKFFSAQWE